MFELFYIFKIISIIILLLLYISFNWVLLWHISLKKIPFFKSIMDDFKG